MMGAAHPSKKINQPSNYLVKIHKFIIIIDKNGHEMDLEMSPGPLGTTIFEEIYIRIQV